jgi:hypothetical protein
MKSKILQSLVSTGALGDVTYLTALIEEGYISEQTAVELAVKTGKFNLQQYVEELKSVIADKIKHTTLATRKDVGKLKAELNETLAEIRDILPEAVQTAVFYEAEIQPEPVILG